MTVINLDANPVRAAATGVDPMFPGRWSPRALSGEALNLADVMPLFEAARWAPSCFNAQPWRFLFSLQGDAWWDRYLDLLVPANQAWAGRAGALVLLVSRRQFEHNSQPAASHSFDAGAAWMSMALQASKHGLVAHGMLGFDAVRARSVLAVPELFHIDAMIALGKPGQLEDLAEAYREREQPSARKPLEEITIAGGFAPN